MTTLMSLKSSTVLYGLLAVRLSAGWASWALNCMGGDDGDCVAIEGESGKVERFDEVVAGVA